MPFHSNTGGSRRPDRESKSDRRQQERLRQREADRKQKERDERARKADALRKQKQAEAIAKAKAEEKARKADALRKQKQAEAIAKAKAEEKAKAEAKAKAKAEAEAKRKAEAEQREKERQERERQAKIAAQEKAKAEAEAKAKAEAEALKQRQLNAQKLADQKEKLDKIRKGVQEANMAELQNAPSPLDEAQYTAMQNLAKSNPDLSVKELVAKSDELIGTDPTTMKNYLVNAGVDIEADTVGKVDLVKLKTPPTYTYIDDPYKDLPPDAIRPMGYDVTTSNAPLVDPKLVTDDVAKQNIQAAEGTVSKEVGEEQINLNQKQLFAKEQTGKVDPILGDTTRKVTEGELVDLEVGQATPEELSEINMVAATAEPSDRATTRGQLELLQKDFEGGKIPPYAAGQIRAANAIMLQRGIGASSIAGQAIMQAALESSVQVAMADAKAFQSFEMASLTNRQQAAALNAQIRAKILGQELTNRQQAAVINAARVSEANNLTFTAEQRVMLENSKMMQQMNLANLNAKQQTALANAATFANLNKANLDARMQAQVANAQNFLQMDMANLKNEQQAKVLEYQSVVQAMFSDQAAVNAAEQFNAKSQIQVDQFYTELNTQIEQANATRNANMQQFNVNQKNAMRQFNETMKLNREKFNTTARLQIDQSNVEWRRQINTANTAEQNAANRLQYQVLTNQTAQAQNNLWNHYRDQASWLMTTAENREQRAHDAAMLAAQISGNKDMYETEFMNNLLLEIGMNL
jgi:hypothetical protein